MSGATPNSIKFGHQCITIRLPTVGDPNGSPYVGLAWSAGHVYLPSGIAYSLSHRDPAG